MTEVRLLSYNIRFGGNGREASISALARACDPDVIVLQEATDPNVVLALSEATGLMARGSLPGHSLAFLSRLEVQATWDKPPGSVHSYLNLELPGQGLRIFGVHLRAVLSRWTEARRTREVQALLKGVHPHIAGFHCLMGDFNSIAPDEAVDVSRFPRWLRVMAWLSGRQIQRWAIAAILEAGYVDGYRALHPSDDGYTFPSWDPHVRLDYVFVPEPFAHRIQECRIIDHAVALEASDHFPLLTTIEV